MLKATLLNRPVVVAVLDRGGRVHHLHGGLVTLCHGDLVLNADVP
jgi:hypothetical protein